MRHFMSGFFRLAKCFQGSLIYQYFIPFYGHIIFHHMDNTPFCLPTDQLINICVVYTFWLFQILQWTFIYMFMREHILSIFFALNLEILVGRMATSY